MKRDMKLVKKILESVESSEYDSVNAEAVKAKLGNDLNVDADSTTICGTTRLLVNSDYLDIINKTANSEYDEIRLTWKGFDLLDDLRKNETNVPQKIDEQPKLVVIPPPPVLPPNTSPFAIRPQPLVDKSTPPGFRP